jgi:hypothetical protein
MLLSSHAAQATVAAKTTGRARRLAPPHIDGCGVGGSSGIGGGCGSANAASAADRICQTMVPATVFFA